MPLEAPVTTATLPFNLSPMCITSLWVRELQRGSSALCRTVGVMYPNSRGTYQGPCVAHGIPGGIRCWLNERRILGWR